MEGDYTKEMFIKEIKKFCDQHGYDPMAVAKKTWHLYFEHILDIDSELYDKMIDLVTMEEGPEFFMTEEKFYRFLDEALRE